MTTDQLREKYLQFFNNKGHEIISSSSLIPENDPTTLFTGSGMQPMIQYLLGQKHPLGSRIANSQKCFRTVDIEEVGDNRHTTFFEMLGNWSLGDYFKKEQIHWYFEFLIKELDLDPDRIYITCFKGNKSLNLPRDEESALIWKEEFNKINIDAKIVDDPESGMKEGKIFYYGEEKNWWSRSGVPQNMPVGEPGGPDSEVFWDFGGDFHKKSKWADQPCHVNCDCGRFIEIGNSVFMQYMKTEDGFTPLAQKNVDFGGGLERTAAAVMDIPDIFMIDVIRPIVASIEEVSGKKYGENSEQDKAFRVIADHLRASTFLISDGAIPSNKDQGYFTRRLTRRAIRYACKLGIHNDFCDKVSKSVIDSYKNHYHKLGENADLILNELRIEEKKFRKTLTKGLKLFEQNVGNLSAGDELDAKKVFDLYQSYGFPLEMTAELAEDRGLKVDKKAFEKELKRHQDLSRSASEGKFKGGLANHSEINIKYHTATHLLHAALRKILGPHVEQRGSNITEKRLRFDFSHPKRMTDEEKEEVENLVNKTIHEDLPVNCKEMSVKEAKGLGAIGLFKDKYDEKVKVYTIGDFSIEICGGPHVTHTGVLGKFRIKKEEASSAGVRRIKAILE